MAERNPEGKRKEENSVLLEQSGEDNSVLLKQSGEDNSALLEQPGEDNSALLEQYIDCAKKFIELTKDLGHLKGASKLQRMCRSELKYLQTLRKSSGPSLCGSHLKSSNLSHFAGCIHAAYRTPGVTQILSPFSAPHGRSENLVVDVVANQGHTWVKVIARKAQALHLIWAGRGQFGERDLVKQAKDYLHCSRKHPVNFRRPHVHFAFYNQVTIPMAACLERLGISVSGERVDVDETTASQISQACVSSDTEDSEGSSESEDQSLEEDCGGDQCEADQHNKLHPEKRFGDLSFDRRQNTIQHSVQHSQEVTGLEKLNIKQPSVKNSSDSPRDCVGSISSFEQPKKDFLFRDIDLLSSLVSSLPSFDCLSEDRHGDDCSASSSVIDRVNLDITSLITLVSSVTNGGCHFDFSEKILAMQASEERQDPALPKLKKFLQGKQLFVCETALEDFRAILDTLGGPAEKHRAEQLLSTVTVVKDDPSQRTKDMPYSLKIRDRSKVIFGTGDKLQAVTMTANSSFVRAAQHQGVSFAVHLHPSRALTEEKEKGALPLPCDQ